MVPKGTDLVVNVSTTSRSRVSNMYFIRNIKTVLYTRTPFEYNSDINQIDYSTN